MSHVIVCWAAKGGSGTTVVACAMALGVTRGQATTLVDLGGDCADRARIGRTDGPGVVDWLASPTAGAAELDRLAITVRDDVRLIPRGTRRRTRRISGSRSGAVLSRWSNVIVDAGTGAPPAALHEAAEHSLLVTRPCFIAIRRAQRSTSVLQASF